MELTIRRPDNFHVHFRRGPLCRLVVPFTARVYARALAMPNTYTPITDAETARSYRDELRAAAAAGGAGDFEPLMTIKLTARTTPETIAAARAAGVVAAKLYPTGATTGSDDGVVVDHQTHHGPLQDVFAAMVECGMVLCVHAEDPAAPIARREAVFLSYVRDWYAATAVPKLVIEHLSTTAAVEFVRQTAGDGQPIAGTITPQHLLHTVDDILSHDGKLDPHRFCYPVYKTAHDRESLRGAATSGEPHFFAGDDSAPHLLAAKASGRIPPGVFSAPASLETYADAFEAEAALDRLEDFTSRFGAEFYGLPLNTDQLTLVRRQDGDTPAYVVPALVDNYGCQLRPYRAAECLRWTVRSMMF